MNIKYLNDLFNLLEEHTSSSKNWGKLKQYREQEAISHVINDFAVIIRLLEILKETKKGKPNNFITF